MAKEATKPLTCKLVSTCEMNCCMSSWKLKKVDVDDNQNLLRMQIEIRSLIILNKPNSGIQTLSYAQLLRVIFFNGQ